MTTGESCQATAPEVPDCATGPSGRLRFVAAELLAALRGLSVRRRTDPS